MKKLLLLMFSVIFLIGCQDTKKQEEKLPEEDSLFGTSFRNYKDLDALDNYEKGSDTAVHMGDSDANYRLMKLKENGGHLILFYKVVERDSIAVNGFLYRAIDTIHVKDLREDERITIGYCQHENFNQGEVIAVIKETDSLYTTDIIKAWRANPGSERIEVLKNHEGIKCLNEFLERENATIPVEKIS